MSKKVCIIDYGMGNVGSVASALNYLGIDYIVSNKHSDISSSDRFILPGVGAFNAAMANLEERDLINLLNDQVLGEKKPILGICIGMQVLAVRSDEGRDVAGLGWFDAYVEKINGDVKVPHVGWNSVVPMKESELFINFNHQEDILFYFDHSYHIKCNQNDIVAKTAYGEPLVSIIQKENIVATQFHPEKSQINGLRLIKNFTSRFMV